MKTTNERLTLLKQTYPSLNPISVQLQEALEKSPNPQHTLDLIELLAKQYTQTTTFQPTPSEIDNPTTPANTIKKRSLGDSVVATPEFKNIFTANSNTKVFHDLSFITPRKKLSLVVSDETVVLLSGKVGADVEVGKDQAVCSFAKEKIAEILVLDTPEKQKPHFTVVFILEPDSGIADNVLIFGFDDKQKDIKYTNFSTSQPNTITLQPTPTLATTLLPHLRSTFTKTPFYNTTTQTFPPTLKFTTTPQTSPTFKSKKNSTAYVPCHKITTPGFLYFLKTGLLFGFKKPILYLRFDEIEEVVVSGVLSRTFNLVVLLRGKSGESLGKKVKVEKTGKGGNDDYVETIEFSMIDSSEIDAVRGYIAVVNAMVVKGAKSSELAKVENKESVAEQTDELEPSGNNEDEEDDDDFEMQSEESCVEEYDSEYNTDDSQDDDNGGGGEDNESSDEETNANGKEEEQEESSDDDDDAKQKDEVVEVSSGIEEVAEVDELSD
ncbi:hypothetical protein HK098_000599 [Nowakowskiella sp. JEL0407]|nr:hypothetical protein HK098_000589 [Nowakowskiella sp. JEL0407]KAJ3125107.1 hypothetical protein HK098_000599 [Nowakowskiella sp. JEL0407]